MFYLFSHWEEYATDLPLFLQQEKNVGNIRQRKRLSPTVTIFFKFL